MQPRLFLRRSAVHHVLRGKTDPEKRPPRKRAIPQPGRDNRRAKESQRSILPDSSRLPTKEGRHVVPTRRHKSHSCIPTYERVLDQSCTLQELSAKPWVWAPAARNRSTEA